MQNSLEKIIEHLMKYMDSSGRWLLLTFKIIQWNLSKADTP